MKKRTKNFIKIEKFNSEGFAKAYIDKKHYVYIDRKGQIFTNPLKEKK